MEKGYEIIVGTESVGPLPFDGVVSRLSPGGDYRHRFCFVNIAGVRQENGGEVGVYCDGRTVRGIPLPIGPPGNSRWVNPCEI
jgi:hypothetical protein